MTQLVTLAAAKAHLRVDHNMDDTDISAKIEAASAAVLAYLDEAQYLFLDTGGELLEFDASGTDPHALRALHAAKQATLLLLTDFYENRGPAPTDPVPADFGYGYLPRAVVALLYPLRDPTFA